jgi:hypothetical protein
MERRARFHGIHARNPSGNSRPVARGEENNFSWFLKSKIRPVPIHRKDEGSTLFINDFSAGHCLELPLTDVGCDHSAGGARDDGGAVPDLALKFLQQSIAAA